MNEPYRSCIHQSLNGGHPGRGLTWARCLSEAEAIPEGAES